MKKTQQEKLQARQINPPNGLLYSGLMQIVKLLNRQIHTTFHFKADPRQDSGPYVIISNHASRVDYQFTGPACYPRKLNFVVGYNEFMRFPICLILKWAQAIPKKNFTPDLYCMRQMRRVIQQGGCLCLMPEGMSSITGMAQPVMIGTGKFLKMLGVPVYYTKVSGGYLTYTKHASSAARAAARWDAGSARHTTTSSSANLIASSKPAPTPAGASISTQS